MIKFIKPGIQVIDRLTLKQLKAGTFGGRFKNKDYPGILNLKRGTKKGKPKLKIV